MKMTMRTRRTSINGVMLMSVFAFILTSETVDTEGRALFQGRTRPIMTRHEITRSKGILRSAHRRRPTAVDADRLVARIVRRFCDVPVGNTALSAARHSISWHDGGGPVRDQ